MRRSYTVDLKLVRNLAQDLSAVRSPSMSANKTHDTEGKDLEKYQAPKGLYERVTESWPWPVRSPWGESAVFNGFS